MSATRLFLFSAGSFGAPFEAPVAQHARDLGCSVTLVRPDPVADMGPIRRRRTRMSRPLRQAIGRVRQRCRVILVEDVNADSFGAAIPAGAHGVSTGFTQIFSQATIDAFATLVNLHPSILPCYRGADPLFWMSINRETHSGCTLHHITAAIDAGPVVWQAVYEHDPVTPMPALIDTALPELRRWVSQLVTGEPHVPRQVDAATVYRCQLDYAVLLPQRRIRHTRRVEDRLPRRLAALFALGDAFRTDSAWRSRLDGCHWSDVLRAAQVHGLQPWLWSACGARPDGLPADVAQTLARAHQANATRNAQLRDQLGRAIAVLGEAEIVPILLADAALLAAPGEEDPGSRPVRQVVLGVTLSEQARAVRLLSRAGVAVVGVTTPDLHAAATEVETAEGLVRTMPATHALLDDLLRGPPRRRPGLAGPALASLLSAQRLTTQRRSEIDWDELDQRLGRSGSRTEGRGRLWLAHRLLGLRLEPSFRPEPRERVLATQHLLALAFAAGWST